MINFVEYLDSNGVSPFAKWFDSLDAVPAAKVRTYIARVELGNYSNVDPIGDGLSKLKLILAQATGYISGLKGVCCCFYWVEA